MRRGNDNKKKYGVILVSVFIVLSMVLSIFAVILDNQQNTLNYNKHKFTITDSGYKVKISGEYMDFMFYPSELERIQLDNGTIGILKSSQAVAFVFNPDENLTDNLVYIDVTRYELGIQLDKPAYFGITNTSETYTLPTIGCANATYYMPIFVLNMSADTGFVVSSENPYCIIMNAKLREILAAKDRLVYTYYGVMN